MTREFLRPIEKRAILLLMMIALTTLDIVATRTVLFPEFDRELQADEIMNDVTRQEKAIMTVPDTELQDVRTTMMHTEDEFPLSHEEYSFVKYRHWYNKPRRKQGMLSKRIENKRQRSRSLEQLPESNSSKRNTPHQHQSSRNIATHKSDREKYPPHTRTARSVDEHPFMLLPSSKSQSLGATNGLLPMGSKDINAIWGRSPSLQNLYHKPSSKMLQIGPGGAIFGVSEMNQYCILRITGVDIERDNKIVVKIYGEVSKMYLAMRRSGHLYTTKHAADPETDFLHEYVPSSHDSYLSRQHRLYITMRDDGKPGRSRNGTSDSAPRRAHFLISNISDTLKHELLASGTITSVAVATTQEPPQSRTTTIKSKNKGRSSIQDGTDTSRAQETVSETPSIVEVTSPSTTSDESLPSASNKEGRAPTEGPNSPLDVKPIRTRKKCRGGKKCCRKRKNSKGRKGKKCKERKKKNRRRQKGKSKKRNKKPKERSRRSLLRHNFQSDSLNAGLDSSDGINGDDESSRLTFQAEDSLINYFNFLRSNNAREVT